MGDVIRRGLLGKVVEDILGQPRRQVSGHVAAKSHQDTPREPCGQHLREELSVFLLVRAMRFFAIHAKTGGTNAENGRILALKIRNHNLRNVADANTQNKTSSLDAKLTFIS